MISGTQRMDSFEMEGHDSSPQSPTYRIFRDQHGIPQFDPKRGSRALKDALIYAFPTLETELQLMQAALKKFFDSERGSSFICELPENSLQVSISKRKEFDFSPDSRRYRSRRSSRASSQVPSLANSRAPSRASSRCETPTSMSFAGTKFDRGIMTTWMLSNGKELEKRKKQPYDAAKRRRVAENRGNACDKHRIAKTACDPEKCPQNKLYLRAQGESALTPGEVSPDSQSTISGSVETVGVTPTEYSAQANLQYNALDEMNTSLNSNVNNNNMFLGQAAPSLDPENQAVFSVSSQLDAWDPSFDVVPMTELSFISTDPLSHFQCSPTAEHAAFLPENAPMNSLSTPDLGDYKPNVPHSADDHTYVTDPFMGWGDKRASQTFDDYGWVLSHVGNL